MANSVNYKYESRDWKVSSGDKPTWLRAKVINGTATSKDDKWVFNVNAGFEADYTLHFTSSDEDGHRVYMILTIKEGNTVLAQVKKLLIGQYYCENLDAQTTISASATSLTSKATKVSVTVDFDFYTDFIGGDDYGHYGKGLYWRSKGTYIYHLYEYGSFSVGDLYQKPSFRTVSISDRTTKSISVYASWNDIQNMGGAYKDADVYVNLYDENGNELEDGNGNKQLGIYGTPGNPSGTVTFDNLPHNTNFKIKVHLWDGVSKVWFKDGNFITTKTRKLTLINDSIIQKQFSIISTWHAEVDDNANSIDGISFRSYLCRYRSGGSSNTCGNTSYTIASGGSSSPNRTVLTEDLESYTEYYIIYEITDGNNIVSKTENVNTLFPYARIYVDGAWHKAMPYIYCKNEDGTYSWKLAKGYIYTNPDDSSSRGFKEFSYE